MRLAYKELEIDRKMEEKKLKSLEGSRREQAERLGMGFGNRRCGLELGLALARAVCVCVYFLALMCASCCSAVSHSVMSEMQVIEQETPVGAKSSTRSKLDLFDEPGFTSGPPK